MADIYSLPDAAGVEKVALNKFASSEVLAPAKGNLPMFGELLVMAQSKAGAVGVDLNTDMASVMGEIVQGKQEIDIRYNPQVYAQGAVDHAVNVAGINILEQSIPTLNSLGQSVNSGQALDAANPTAVFTETRRIVAQKHTEAMGDIDEADETAWITAKKFLPGYNPAAPDEHFVAIDSVMETQIRANTEAARQRRIAQVTADFQSGKMSIADVRTILAKGNINPQVETALKKLIEPAEKIEKTKIDVGVEVVGAGPRPGLDASDPDQIATLMLTTDAYLNAPPEAQAAMRAQLRVDKQRRENATLDDKEDKEINKLTMKEEKRKMDESSRKEILTKLKIAMKWGGGLALLFALGGPAGFAAITSTGGLASLGIMSGGAGAAGFLIGGGLGFTLLSKNNAEVIKSQKDKLIAKKALRAAELKTPELEAAQKRRKLNERISSVRQYANLYAQGKGYDPALVATEMMKGTRLDNVNDLLRALS